MPNARFELALERMSSTDWRAFEKLASEFLAIEYPALRTMASPSGDRGRDAEPFSVEGERHIAFQYSVRQDWEAKIAATLKRLKETLPKVNHLIYVTNIEIGAKADDVKATLRKESIALDVRDRSWFIERETTHPQRAAASEEVMRAFVEPLLAQRKLIGSAGRLSADNADVALLHLALEDEDDATERSITKRCFESLVAAALDGTTALNTLTTADIQARVKTLIPAGAPGQVEALVSSALTRLTTKQGPVKRVGKADSFHMSFEESERLKEKTAAFILSQHQMEQELAAHLSSALDRDISEDQVAAALPVLRDVVECVLFRSGEGFAKAVSSGDTFRVSIEVVSEELAKTIQPLLVTLDEGVATILALLEHPSLVTQTHLRRISDAYTLFAFLRQTPDVQKVILQVFSHGDIWLDTSAILPLIGESLIEDESNRQYTILLRAAVDAGLNLYLTDGVLEEVERHLNRCVAFTHMPASQWVGRVPFVYLAYILSGRPSSAFIGWQEEMRGTQRPLEDVRDYLANEFSIRLRSLKDLADAAPVELRGAVQELWEKSHEERRARGQYDVDSAVVSRLVSHDVENTVGIIELRRSTPDSPMGYQQWWLTLDRTARSLRSHLRDQLGPSAPPSPVLSPDFLTQLLRLGPMRTAIDRELRVAFPIVVDVSRLETIPRELLALADKVRAESVDLSERLVQRKVRDALDETRAKRGPEVIRSQRELEEQISSAIVSGKRK